MQSSDLMHGYEGPYCTAKKSELAVWSMTGWDAKANVATYTDGSKWLIPDVPTPVKAAL